MPRIIVPASPYLDEVAPEGARTLRVFQQMTRQMPGYQELTGASLLRRDMMRELSQGRNLYSHFPFVFADALPEVRTQQLRRLSVSALFFLQHVLLADELLDENQPSHYAAVVFSNTFQALGWQLLVKAAGSRRLPWAALGSYYREYHSAVIQECRDHRKNFCKYSREDLIRIVSRRCAVSKIITCVLCLLGNRPELAPRLDESLDNYWLADCMLDDWRDWKIDLKHARYTYFLTARFRMPVGSKH